MSERRDDVMGGASAATAVADAEAAVAAASVADAEAAVAEAAVAAESVAALRERLAELVQSLDPDLLETGVADGLLTELIAIGQLAHAGSIVVARRAIASGRWKSAGEHSAGHHLARRMGTSVYAADQLLTAARRLDALPDIAAELRSGGLSPRKAQLIVDAGRLAPGRQRELVGAARRESFATLKSLCDKIAAAHDPRPDSERHADAHTNRRMRWESKSDATFSLDWSNTTSAGVELISLLQPFIDAEFDKARQARRAAAERGEEIERDHPDAVAADALLAMARAVHAGGGVPGGRSCRTSDGGGGSGDDEVGDAGAARRSSGSRCKVIVRIDHQALLRGNALDTEVCEINGIGPIPVSAVRELMDDAFIAAILTDGVDIRSVVHLGRSPTALQRTALEWRDPVCSVTGCGRSRQLEIDHVDDWARTRQTTLDKLMRLCGDEHDLKSYEGYTLVTDADGCRSMRQPPGGSRSGADADRQAKARRKRGRGNGRSSGRRNSSGGGR